MSANGIELGVPVILLAVAALLSCLQIPSGIGLHADRRRMFRNKFVWIAAGLAVMLGALAVCIVIWAPVRLKVIALPAAFMSVFVSVLISKRVRGISL